MGIAWDPELSTTIAEIDNQHRELLRQIDVLLQAWAGGRGLSEVEMILKFLESYVEVHFGTEKAYMTRYVYPNRTAHLAQHEVFIQTLNRLKGRYFQQGADAELIAETNELIVDWFLNHIRYVDKALGMFLKFKIPAGEPVLQDH